jgi:hypothetical protein
MAIENGMDSETRMLVCKTQRQHLHRQSCSGRSRRLNDEYRSAEDRFNKGRGANHREATVAE